MFDLVTASLPVNILLFILGLMILVKGSDWFVEAAAHIAREYHVSEMVVGLTLVSLGTSLPEIATDIYAAAMDQPAIALGNIVGSNITNVTLVLAVGVLFVGVFPVPKSVVSRDGVVMMLVYGVFMVLCFLGSKDGVHFFNRFDAGVLLFIGVAYLVLLFKSKRVADVDANHERVFASLKIAWLFVAAGLVMIFFGAKCMVDNTVWLAEYFNVPKAIVAATVVAFGTSVPELAVTVTGVCKGRNDIAIGNIVGSCIFNILFGIGLAALVAPLAVDAKINYILNPMMLASGIVLLAFCRTEFKLKRWEGVVLLFLYALFLLYNFQGID